MTHGVAMRAAIDSRESVHAWLIGTLAVDSDSLTRLDRLVEMLTAENDRQNLVAQASLVDVWARHIADSAQLLAVPRGTRAADPASGAWLDLGTGAGFPGLVIAALQPTRAIMLVDSRRLRTDWLKYAVHALRLDHVRVVLSRVEELPTAAYAVISARAFAPLPRLLKLSARFSTPQTLWLLPKGAKARHELAELGDDWRHTFHVEQSLTNPAAGVLVGQVLNTPDRKGAHR